MASSSSTAATTHILVFPFPAQGHMLPLLDLTHKLALKGLNITVLITPKNLPILSPLLTAHPSIQTLVLPFPHHPKLPLGVEHMKDIGDRGKQIVTCALSKLEDPIIQWFKYHPSPPHVILSDFFLGWTNYLAGKLNVPRIGFFSSGFFLTSVLEHLLVNMEAVRGLEVVEFPDLPRSPSFNEAHLPSIIRRYKESDYDWKILRDSLLANFSSWGCVFNSFTALEGEYLDHLKNKLGQGQHHIRVYGVGPLRLIGGGGGGGESLALARARALARVQLQHPDESDTSVLNWLDDQPEGSVLYVCFGSQKLLTRTQTEALAVGLEHSMTRFIWVVRSAKYLQVEEDGGRSHEAIPDGFEERVRDRGLVIKGWAPQVEILNHKAVGGFMSRCGWNSLQESVAAGVMILAWPMDADQFINARLLVDDLGVAVRVHDGGEDAAPDSVQLAKIISETMNGNLHLPQKEKAKELKHKAFEAVEDGGSSSTSLAELVKELNQLGSS
ncbi:hypothetical protein Dimus_014788 [Dionaea muscipula]